MARNVRLNSIIYYLFIISVLIHEIISYEKILLDESRLCKLKPEDPDASVFLEKERGSSKIVTQETYFATWTGRYNFKCSFSVTAPRDYGIYAVIQVLNFRKNETTGKCRDYVHIRVPQDFLSKIIKDRKHEKYFCGRIFAAQTYIAHSNDSRSRYGVNPVADNSFVAPNGHIHVTIYVAQQRLLIDEKLEIKIAFTSYKYECRTRQRHIQCRQCEWIWEGLLGDNIQNCPYTSCLDEDHCKNLESPFEVIDVISNETGTKVTIVAVCVIMISLLTFGICLCECRRSQRCCWHIPPNSAERMEMNRPRSHRADEIVMSFPELPADPISPSAPPISDVKDVPPSYESLFPSK